MKLLFKDIVNPKFVEAFKKYSSLKLKENNIIESLKFSRLARKLREEQDIYDERVNGYKKSVVEEFEKADESQRVMILNKVDFLIYELQKCESELEPLFSIKRIKEEMELNEGDLTALLPIFHDAN